MTHETDTILIAWGRTDLYAHTICCVSTIFDDIWRNNNNNKKPAQIITYICHLIRRTKLSSVTCVVLLVITLLLKKLIIISSIHTVFVTAENTKNHLWQYVTAWLIQNRYFMYLNFGAGLPRLTWFIHLFNMPHDALCVLWKWLPLNCEQKVIDN